MSQEGNPSESRIAPSLTNIGLGSAPGISVPIEAVLEPRDLGPSAKSAAELESKLEDEQALRKKERFIWMLITTLLADCLLFKLEDAILPDAFVILISILGLMVMANYCEVSFAHVYLERIFNRFISDAPASETGSKSEES